MTSDSGPMSSCDSAIATVYRLTEKPISVSVVPKCVASAGKEGNRTSRGKTPSSTMVSKRVTALRRFFATMSGLASVIDQSSLGKEPLVEGDGEKSGLVQRIQCGA
ncbi:hypothetical protein D3C73_1408300 [compost metagenome]